MEIDGKEVPLTATHYSHSSKEFLRVSKGKYAQCLIKDKYWTECATLTNEQLIRNENPFYRSLFKTGLNRDIANLRLIFIGSNYRVGA